MANNHLVFHLKPSTQSWLRKLTSLAFIGDLARHYLENLSFLRHWWNQLVTSKIHSQFYPSRLSAWRVCSIKFTSQSRSIEIAVFFFQWKTNSKNYIMFKNHGQNLYGFLQICLLNFISKSDSLFCSFERSW